MFPVGFFRLNVARAMLVGTLRAECEKSTKGGELIGFVTVKLARWLCEGADVLGFRQNVISNFRFVGCE